MSPLAATLRLSTPVWFAWFMEATGDEADAVWGDTAANGRARVPGMDAAGVIDEVGTDVTGWAVGDEVMAIALSRGDTLAVTGAAGLLGNYVVQLAVAAGLTVIADAAPADEALVRSLGPAHIVARGDLFAAAVRALVPDGVDALADAAVQREVVVDAVRDGGVFLDVRGWSGNDSRGIRFEQVAVFSEYRSFDKLEQLRHAVEGGTVVPRVAEVLPASRAGGGA